MEEWRDHPRYGALVQASSLGRVRQFIPSERAYVLQRQRIHKSGYPVCNLRAPINRQSVKMHSIVCECFYGIRPRGMDVGHKNGDRCDNRPENLTWCTRRQNLLHAKAHGTIGACPAIRAAASTPRQPRLRHPIVSRRCQTCGSIFESRGGRPGNYCSRKCTANRDGNRKLMDRDRLRIAYLANRGGMSIAAIARRFGVSATHVRRIRDRGRRVPPSQ